MSEHHARIAWTRTTDGFRYEDYNREHRWIFPGGIEMQASAAPAFLGREGHVDPEEAFVAAVSSCHMLTLLAICARRRWVVDAYTDNAVGVLEKNEAGRLAVTRVLLAPDIRFAGDNPTREQLAWLHHRSHEECFIANSVRTEIRVQGFD